MSKYVKFYYINRQKKRVEYEIHQRDIKDFKIYLLESSYTENLGDIFIEDDGKWKLLDYYND